MHLEAENMQCGYMAQAQMAVAQGWAVGMFEGGLKQGKAYLQHDSHADGHAGGGALDQPDHAARSRRGCHLDISLKVVWAAAFHNMPGNRCHKFAAQERTAVGVRGLNKAAAVEQLRTAEQMALVQDETLLSCLHAALAS